MDAYQLSQVRFAYRANHVIDIKQLNIPSNTSTVILGDNGAGKTTLLGLLGCVLTPTSGDIFFQKQKISRHNSLSMRRRIAALHQRPYLFRGSVLDNAALALKLRGTSDSIAKQAAMLGLQQVGLSNLANRVANTLSGGEAQRVALVRCLVTNPEVLLLDEPFSHLDRNSVSLIENVVADFVSSGGTLVFSTHDHRRWPDLADYVITLKNGTVDENYWM